ncbi:MAG TPA: M28 family peptidase, partial [Thermoanaerobaculia bacterium]|nr:M28 family peptidase [Thermoanaerobaculia bacterium]
CNARPVCAMVENVIARAPGGRRADAVVLMAHYDSVGAGPGAADDGMGVAALLEIARATRGERHRNPLLFLITDGEEAGLLGAEAFLADGTLAREVGVVLNVESRGTRGLSNMFETSRRNRWLIHHLSRSLERPQATSFFYAIYNLLPNDTDVTVFRRAGKAAVNFAAIQGVNAYHTPLDNLANADPRTLQHHGDNLLAAGRAFASVDLDARSRDDASYFDVLGFVLLWWPAGTTIWVAIASLVLLVFAARKMNARAITFGVLMTFTAVILAVAFGTGTSWLARLRNEEMNWVAHPLPSIAAMWLAGIAAALLAAAMFRRRSDERALLFGAAVVWHTLAIALTIALPGASFLFLVPALAVTICALAQASDVAVSAIASSVAAILIFPLGVLLYEALGGRLMSAIAILIGITATLAAPLFARVRFALAAAAGAIVCALIAVALPEYSPERPRILSIQYVDDAAAKTPAWQTPRRTPELQRVARFAEADTALVPWGRRQFAAPAPPAGLARVTVEGTRDGSRATIRVRSPRRANRLVLVFRGGDVTRMNGVVPPPPTARSRPRLGDDWRYVSAAGVEEMVVEIAARGPIEAIASDMTFGLPASGAALLRARDASTAVPSHDGDVTLTRARVKL